MVCVVLGTINHVVGGNDWWYAACVCNKGVIADSKRFFCPKCNKHIWTIVPRYRIRLRVIDETDSATFVLFDRDCYSLTRKTCLDLIEEMDNELEPTIVPRIISGFVEQTMLFKIEVKNDDNSGFEKSFRVKKVCADKEIVNKFKSVMKNSTGIEDDSAVGVDQRSMDVGVVQDLNSKFQNAIADDMCEDTSSVSKPIGCDAAECSPVKRDFVEVANEDDGSSTRITKNIKIEKD
ncbi:uncharacterized protein LOC131599564 [Vicia villosa]|uniref:uncharacterized protein LOC131599564 n=1 Tax=Vicia villosa TaxID=3911 RepID=UPI00273B880D|nr:uncharacterized protein LOC131599564 [Vicia villosa]